MELTKQDQDYIDKVDSFFKREGLDSLSEGTMACPDCHEVHPQGNAYINQDTCLNPECKFNFEESLSESYFSWSNCNVCARPLSGDRHDMVGYNPKTKEIQGDYSVCIDCILFIANGDLPENY